MYHICYKDPAQWHTEETSFRPLQQTQQCGLCRQLSQWRCPCRERSRRPIDEGRKREGRKDGKEMGSLVPSGFPDRMSYVIIFFPRFPAAIYHRVFDFPAEQMNIQLKFEDSSTGAKSNVHLMPCEIDHDGIAKVGSGDGGH